MKRAGIIILSLCFLAAASAQGSGINRIIGGKDASISQYPYQISLRFFGKHTCGGSIISEKHILIAAHCVVNYDRLTYQFFVKVYTGTSSSVSGGHSHGIANIKVHPGYEGTEDSSVRHDIAIITLRDRIVFDENQQKISLPSHAPRDGDKAILTGWGLTSNTAQNSPTRLQQSDMKIITSKKCQQYQSTKIYEEQVCAFHSEGVGACLGDSGGPLAVDGEVVGIVSFVDGDYCAPGTPDVYTNVFAYKDFIESAINQ